MILSIAYCKLSRITCHHFPGNNDNISQKMSDLRAYVSQN